MKEETGGKKARQRAPTRSTRRTRSKVASNEDVEMEKVWLVRLFRVGYWRTYMLATV